MTEIEVLEEQVEKLKNAVSALASFARSPQERLDSALSYFVRTFRSSPEGEAFEHYRAIYTAIGDPPVGTTIQVRLDTVAAHELETVGRALIALCEILTRRHADALARAATAALSAETSAIETGTLETLVPGRAWST